jgi:hypothetical protein
MFRPRFLIWIWLRKTRPLLVPHACRRRCAATDSRTSFRVASETGQYFIVAVRLAGQHRHIAGLRSPSQHRPSNGALPNVPDQRSLRTSRCRQSPLSHRPRRRFLDRRLRTADAKHRASRLSIKRRFDRAVRSLDRGQTRMWYRRRQRRNDSMAMVQDHNQDQTEKSSLRALQRPAVAQKFSRVS